MAQDGTRTHIREPKNFGTRQSTHSITISRNGKTSHFNVNPALFSVGFAFMFMFAVGYFGATAYLVFRDDLIGAQQAREARMQHEYEDRIAALRSKLDRVTSRQLLDQQAIENKVAALLKRQEALGTRGGDLSKVLERAKARGLNADQASLDVPVPKARPSLSGDSAQGLDSLQTGSVLDADEKAPGKQASLAFSGFDLRGTSTMEDAPSLVLAFQGEPQSAELPEADTRIATAPVRITPQTLGTLSPSSLFAEVAEAIDVIDATQRETIDGLRNSATDKARQIASVLDTLGVKVSGDVEQAIGGPFIPYDHSAEFEDHLEALDQSLDILDQLSSKARTLPVSNPVPGTRISSRFGSRVDPFVGRVAMHSGIDFAGPTGTRVFTAGEGTVIKAGRAGGYGKMVEIKHTNGLTTRYAHLSRISVKKGQKVSKGTVVGKIGSTGRSTGPHLHFEVRRSGKAINPMRYIEAGRKLGKLL